MRPSKKDRIIIKTRKLKLSEWSRTVRLRDNNTCVCCEVQNEHLDAHHILYQSIFPEFSLMVNNGMTVCKTCHEKIHKLLP